MSPQTTLKRQAGADVNFNNGRYIALCENSYNLQEVN